MEQQQFDEIRESIRLDFIGSRIDGLERFKRAFWYGSSGRVGRFLGNGKGARKEIRNIPKALGKKVVSSVVLLPFKAPMALLPGGVSYIVNPLLNLAIVTPATMLLDEVISRIDSKYQQENINGESIKGTIKNKANSIKNKAKSMMNIGSTVHDDKLRKEIKHAAKDMISTNALLVIDRNLVKMKDAKHSMETEVKKLDAVLGYEKPSFDGLEQQKLDAVYNTLFATYETEHYVKKITSLVDAMQEALGKLKGQLEELNKGIDTAEDKIEEYIMAKI